MPTPFINAVRSFARRNCCFGAYAFLSLIPSVAAADGYESTSAYGSSDSSTIGYWLIYRPVKLVMGAGVPSRTVYYKDEAWDNQWRVTNITEAGYLVSEASQHDYIKPSASVAWSGLSASSGPKTGTASQWAYKFTWSVNADYSNPQVVNRDPITGPFTVSYNSSSARQWQGLPPITVTIDAAGVGVVVDPAAPQPVVNPLAVLEGKEIMLPFFGRAGKNVFELNGIASDVMGDENGAGILRFKVPANWDGTVKFNGVTAMIATSLGGEYEPQIANQLIGSLYSNDLPAGMYRWNPASDLVLPAGITAGTKLPLPEGMTVAPAGSMNGDLLSIWREVGGTTQNFQYDTSTVAPLPAGGTGGAGSTAGAGVTTPGSGDEMGAGAAMAAADSAVAKGKEGGASTVPGGEASVQKLETLRGELKMMFSEQGPLAPGNLPRNNVLHVSVPFGQFGNIDQQIDFGQTPWTIIRAAILVCFTVYLGASYIRFLHV